MRIEERHKGHLQIICACSLALRRIYPIDAYLPGLLNPQKVKLGGSKSTNVEILTSGIDRLVMAIDVKWN
jgi:hypothetical protein